MTDVAATTETTAPTPAAKNVIGTQGVAWVPPEILGRYPGEYRLVEVDGAGSESPTGTLVQWVDDAPNDPADGAGHFEAFEGTDESYTPSRSA